MQDFPSEIYSLLFAREKSLRISLGKNLSDESLKKQHDDAIKKLNNFKSKNSEHFI
jgi:hypothetical protein